MDALPAPRPDVLSFLAAVKESPDDPAPPLVLADWLDEFGGEADRARAEVIRTWHALRSLPPVALSERQRLVACLAPLEKRWGPTWLGPLNKRLEAPTFHPCLVSGRISLGTFLSSSLMALQASEEWAWVGGVRVSLLPATSPTQMERLADSPLLASLVSLSLSQGGLGSAGVRVLLESPHLSQLQTLDLSSNGIDSAGGGALASCDSLPRLRTLNLEGNILGPDGARRLARRLPPDLLSLDLSRNALGDDGVTALANSPHLAHIRSLTLTDNRFGQAGALALAASPYLEDIENLILFGNRVLTEGADALRQRFGKRVALAW